MDIHIVYMCYIASKIYYDQLYKLNTIKTIFLYSVSQYLEKDITEHILPAKCVRYRFYHGIDSCMYVLA